MSESVPESVAEVELAVEAKAADDEYVDRLAKRLLEDIRSLGLVQIRRKALDETPPGSRTGAATQIGVLIISGIFSTATVTATRDIILRRMARSSTATATVRWRAGDQEGDLSLDAEGMTPTELATLVAAWNGKAIGQAGAAEAIESGEAGTDGPQDRTPDRE